MSDFTILLIVAVFTALTWLLVVLCDRLMGEKR
jgi:hypothetical protein